jgi:hypothetical protein
LNWKVNRRLFTQRALISPYGRAKAKQDRRQTAIFSTGLRRWFLQNLLKTADRLRHSQFKA